MQTKLLILFLISSPIVAMEREKEKIDQINACKDQCKKNNDKIIIISHRLTTPIHQSNKFIQYRECIQKCLKDSNTEADSSKK